MGLHAQTMTLGDCLGCGVRTAEIAGVASCDGLFAQGVGQLFGLPSAVLIEFNVGVPLDAGGAVPGGFAVAHGEDAGDLQDGSRQNAAIKLGRRWGVTHCIVLCSRVKCLCRTVFFCFLDIAVSLQNVPMPQSASVSEGDFSSLFSFLPIGAYRSTDEGRMVRVNPALVKINGYSSEVEALHVINRSDSNWYVLPTRRREFFDELRRDGFVRSFVSEVRRRSDGVRMWVNENAHEVHDATGRVLYFEGTVEDITERVLAEQAVQRSEAQLRLVTSQIPGMEIGRASCRERV